MLWVLCHRAEQGGFPLFTASVDCAQGVSASTQPFLTIITEFKQEEFFRLIDTIYNTIKCFQVVPGKGLSVPTFGFETY